MMIPRRLLASTASSSSTAATAAIASSRSVETISTNQRLEDRKAVVRSLYRQFLRIHQQWPSEPTRPGRNLRDYLQQRIHTAFRSSSPPNNNDISSANLSTWNKMVEDAQYRLKHLRQLADSIHAKKYSVAETFVPVYRPAYKLLDTDVQLKQTNIKAYNLLLPMIQTYAEQALDKVRSFLGMNPRFVQTRKQPQRKIKSN